MKPSFPSLVRQLAPALRAALCAGAFLAAGTAALAQATLNPDPELFDGSKTKKTIPQDEKKTKVDDWEGPNMIVYDSDQPGADGGIGTQDTNIAGNDIDLPGGGNGMAALPTSGGAAGGQPGPQIPTAEQSAAGGSQNDASTAGAAQSATKPDEMAIGDDSRKISTASRNPASANPEKGDVGQNDSKQTSEDTTEIPQAASGQQSGGRPGGSEKGVGMPSSM